MLPVAHYAGMMKIRCNFGTVNDTTNVSADRYYEINVVKLIHPEGGYSLLIVSAGAMAVT